MGCLRRCLLRLCFDGGGEVPPPTQRPIPHNPHGRTAPYHQQPHHRKLQPRSEYPTHSQRRVYVNTNTNTIQTTPLPPPKSLPYQQHQKKKNDRHPPACRETRWLDFDQQSEDDSEDLSSPSDGAVPQDYYPAEKRGDSQRLYASDDAIPPDSYPDENSNNLQRLSSPWDGEIPQDYYPDEKQDDRHRLSAPYDDIIPQDGYDEFLPEYYPYTTKQEEEQQETFHQPTTISSPATGTGRSNFPISYIPSYYGGNSFNVVTPSRPPTPPLPPPPPAKCIPHYEYLSDEDPSYENPSYEDRSADDECARDVDEGEWKEEGWADQEYKEWEEIEREEQDGQRRDQTDHQDPRIVSDVSALSCHSEPETQRWRPVSFVSAVSSSYSGDIESRTPTPEPEVRPVKLWGNARYPPLRLVDDTREKYNWL